MDMPVKALKEPLSDLHAMLAKVRREKHAGNFNRLLNHPEVYPYVHGATVGPMDMTGSLADPDIILLMGQHGGIMYQRHQPGLFEIHCQCYPEGRGSWMMAFAQACQHWIFTRTECVEVMTRLPRGFHAARALATKNGMEFQFRNPTGWVMRNTLIPADIYSIHVNNWLRDAPGLEERGHWFHAKLSAEIKKITGQDLPEPSNPGLARYVGAAYEMVIAGQPDKATIFFNRWAALSNYQPIMISCRDPLAIAFGETIIVVRNNGDFYVASTALNQA